MLGGERLGKYRVSEGDSLLVDDHGVSAISGPDFAIGIADELETPRFHRTRITFAY
jgi:putative NADH-flavin reductase